MFTILKILKDLIGYWNQLGGYFKGALITDYVQKIIKFFMVFQLGLEIGHCWFLKLSSGHANQFITRYLSFKGKESISKSFQKLIANFLITCSKEFHIFLIFSFEDQGMFSHVVLLEADLFAFCEILNKSLMKWLVLEWVVIWEASYDVSFTADVVLDGFRILEVL